MSPEMRHRIDYCNGTAPYNACRTMQLGLYPVTYSNVMKLLRKFAGRPVHGIMKVMGK